MPINGPFPLPSKVATKADVGLANVDNTPDSSKPVSGPQQAALDGKAALAHTHAPADITSLVEFIQDTVAAFLVQGANVTLTYDDSGNTLTIAATGGGGGGDLVDGNYGDVTVSGGGTVITINSDVVTFAKMQEIATGTVIGRTTAGTGNPETITMAALKTALDVGIADVSGLSAALGDKLNAASPTSTGIAQHTGAFNLPTTAPGGAVLESDAGGREYSFSTSGAFTINATPPDGRVFGPVGVSNTDINPITRTLPVIGGLTWINDNDGSTLTELAIDANSRIEFVVRRLGTQLRVIGLPAGSTGGGYDTPEEVRGALETLTGANRLDASAIQNLPNPEIPPVLQGIADLTPSEGDLLQWQSGAWALLPFSNLVVAVAEELGVDSVPAAFTAGQWSVTDTTEGGEIEVTVSELPSDGGSAITAIQYSLDGGAWTAFSPPLSTTGTRTITGLTDDQEYDIQLRAVNAIGNGAASDTKQVTPTEAAAPGGSVSLVGTAQGSESFTSTHTATVPAGVQVGDRIVVLWETSVATTAVVDNESTLYTEITLTGNRKMYLSAPLSAVPTTVTVTLGGNDFMGISIAVLRGVDTTTPNNSAANDVGVEFTTTHSVPYTTSADGQFVIGFIGFTGGFSTFTPDGTHTWVRFGEGQNWFLLARATAGSYSATGTTNTGVGATNSTVIFNPA